MASYDGVHIGTYSVRKVKYLRLWWYTGNGSKRDSESLGAAAKIPKTEWKALRLKKEAQLGKRPAGNLEEAPTLAEWWDEYLALRPTLGETTKTKMQKTHDLLVELFGADKKIDTLTKRNALEWRAWLTKRLVGRQEGKWEAGKVSPVTVANHIRIANNLMGDNHGAAKVYEHIKNPFKGERMSAPSEKRDHPDLSKKQLSDLVAAAPDPASRCLIALIAYAGLRLNEALTLQWDAIKWGKRHLIATASKNTSEGKNRPVLMEQELEAVLKKGKKANLESPCAGITQWPAYSLIKRAQAKANLAPWPNPYQALRRLRDSTWSLEYPGYVVGEWLGHSERVSKTNYLTAPGDVYKQKIDLSGLTDEELQEVATLVKQIRKRRNIGATSKKKTKKTPKTPPS